MALRRFEIALGRASQDKGNVHSIEPRFHERRSVPEHLGLLESLFEELRASRRAAVLQLYQSLSINHKRLEQVAYRVGACLG